MVFWITYRKITKGNDNLHRIDGNKVVLANYARDLLIIRHSSYLFGSRSTMRTNIIAGSVGFGPLWYAGSVEVMWIFTWVKAIVELDKIK
jgi:hypothetical protein